MSAHGPLFAVFLLLFLSTSALRLVHVAEAAANGMVATEEMVPLIEEGKVLMMNESRRRLGSFQICASCTCCGAANGYCLPSPCCYAIDCNIPNRPFGFCSFTPKTCHCFGCHL